MKFKSSWITTKEFQELKPINVFHKELNKVEIEVSPIQNFHVHFRKKMMFYGKKKVSLFISADDYYKLYINERFVCQGPAPAYVDSYNYNQIDISSFLQEGENVFAVHVYYQGLINRVWNSGDNRMGMIADLYADGEYLGGTDETWLYQRAKEYSGETIGYDTQFLENIDFRLKESGWKKADFDDSDYRHAVILKEDDHIFQEEARECLSVYRIKPAEIVHLGKGNYFLDFGSEIVGQFTMQIRGLPGQKVRICCGEEVEETDSHRARCQMRCNCNYQEECILSGDKDELEFYDYKAFRYVNIFSEQDNLCPRTFGAVVRHHAFVEKLRLSSDLPYVENIWRLCVNSLKWGVQEGFLDCPSREKGQYLGDFTVTGLAWMHVTGDTAMYRKTLFDFAASSACCPGLMSVVPGSFMQEIADFSLQYPMQVMNYYHYTRDEESLRALYPICAKVVEYFEQYERGDGLLEGVDDKWNLIDWPANLRDGYEIGGEDHSRSNPCHNVLNAHYIGAVDCVWKMKELLGIEADDKPKRLRRAFLEAFYEEETGLFYDTPERSHAALHSNVLPVFYDIAPQEAWDNIIEMIMEKGLVCGTCFSYFVLKALGKMGAYRQELELLTNEGIHSWVNMLKEGATTCFEAWGKEQKWNTSLCHPWSCAPVIVLVEDLEKQIEGIYISAVSRQEECL